MITIEAKATAQRRPIVPSWRIPFPGDRPSGGAPLTLAELIARIVRHEVAAFRERQDRGRFIRVLSEREIRDGAERGRIDPGGRDLEQIVDPEAAVGVALQGFEDGLYFVLVDRHQYERLDEQVVLGPDSTVTFLRLVPLAGG